MKTERIHLRITEDLKTKAQAAAERENRTLSNYIINLINEDLKGEEEMKNIETIERNDLIMSYELPVDHEGNFENEADFNWWAKLADSLTIVEDFKNRMEQGFEEMEKIEYWMDGLDGYNDLAERIQGGEYDWMLDA